MNVRKVSKDILFDYRGVNPLAAKVFGFPDIAEDEILVLDGQSEENEKTTIEHEQKEYEKMSNGMSYWEAHTSTLKELEGYKGVRMDNIIRKTVTCEVKELEDRCLEFVGSTEEPDRMGDVVRLEGWNLKNYMKNPVFMWAHDYKSPPIGKCMKVWPENGKLMFKIQFAPKETYEFADTCYKLYKGGYLNAVSVGFAPDEEKSRMYDGGGTEFNGQELLELSGVPIPACADALVSARANKVITMKEFRLVTKPEETEDYIRIPVKECKITATIDISKEQGIKALYCGDSKEVATYLFSKDKGWTMEKAKKWVEDHKKSLSIQTDTFLTQDGTNFFYVEPTEVPQPKEISQEEIKDEIDYLSSLIDTGNFNDDNKALMKDLVTKISRFLGCDNPIDDTEIDNILKDVRLKLDESYSKYFSGGK